MENLYIAVLIIIIIIILFYMYKQSDTDTFIGAHRAMVLQSIEDEKSKPALSVHSSLVDNPSPRGLTLDKVKLMEKSLMKKNAKGSPMERAGIYDKKATLGDAESRYRFVNYVKNSEIDKTMRENHKKFVDGYLPFSNTSQAIDNLDEALAMSYAGQGITAFRRHAVPQSQHSWQLTEFGAHSAARNNTELDMI